MFKSYISLEVRILLFGDQNNPSGGKTFYREAPDTVPDLNPLAARKAYLLIRGLGGTVVKDVPYERNRIVPPVPSAYQLSRLSTKMGADCFLDIMFHRRQKRIRIPELRLEEDYGRLIRPEKGSSAAYMDYSRAGMPLLRLRTAADLEIGEEAEVFLTDLRRRLQYLELIPAAPGTKVPWETVIRCNAYVALASYPEAPDQYVKLRNLNSFNFVSRAVNAELSRQEEIVINGGTVPVENRIWNEAKSATEPFKVRAEVEKPSFERLDIPHFTPGPDILEALDNFTVELPEARRNRMMEAYGLTQYQAEFICDELSRADYFEKAVKLGAIPKEAAQWLASFVVKECKRRGFTVSESPLGPARFAAIMGMLKKRRIHGNIAKQLIITVLEENVDPERLVKERGWEQLTDRREIERIVKKVIGENPQEVKRIREGDAGPIQFLTGSVMKETGGLAEPTLVKEVLNDQLSVSLIYVLSMGGAISGRIAEDGTLEAGDEKVLRNLLANTEFSPRESAEGKTENIKVRFESIQVGRILSEDITPSDWAALIETIVEKLNSGTANGIVVAHGTDTLPYTAPLLYWLFADAGAPVVLAVSSSPPGAGQEAARTIRKAVGLALSKPKGVYVVNGGKVLSPLNLKYERIGNDGFRNWNMGNPVFTGTSLLTGPLEADQYVLSQLLEDAANSMCVIRIYPGLRPDYL
ncbi:MAG: asparaginase domain-containing protein, partial [Spirochaetaceae bacterium]|nr:asparaginase domain-containing protein [Spirochaetaceae bacterium]